MGLWPELSREVCGNVEDRVEDHIECIAWGFRIVLVEGVEGQSHSLKPQTLEGFDGQCRSFIPLFFRFCWLLRH